MPLECEKKISECLFYQKQKRKKSSFTDILQRLQWPLPCLSTVSKTATRYVEGDERSWPYSTVDSTI